MRHFLFALFLLSGLASQAQPILTAYETSGGKESFTYEAGIRYCQQLDSLSPYVKLFSYGSSDAGRPIHVLVYDASQDFNPTTDKEVILINNAIHPGEPDGVEASLMLLRDLSLDSSRRKRWSNVRLIVIPFYNIGGALNRNSHSRANQVGPEAYGFRGNAKNLDLNRDFIKADAQNTFAFYTIFHTWKPHVFMDTHVSNGADYQYTMTLIHSQNEKYGPQMDRLIENFFIPNLYNGMYKRGMEMVPYVNVHGVAPDSGIHAFFETPRYSNGYVAMWDCISLVSETHMLKPFDQRVKATYALLEELIQTTSTMHPSRAKEKEKQGRALALKRGRFLQTVKWKPMQYTPHFPSSPFAHPDSLLFKGYEAGYKKSEVSGLPRLYYDRSKPFQKKIAYHDKFVPDLMVRVPKAYYVPAQWTAVTERLKANGIALHQLEKDSLVVTEVYYIDSFGTSTEAYESHYVHSGTKVSAYPDSVTLHAGDYLVYVEAENLNFLVNVLEPIAPDSYFNWNFFDGILQQKEWFSAYVFEDIAAQMLQEDPELKKRFERIKNNNPDFANSSFEQLYFIYRNSPYYERTHRRYPVIPLH